MGGGGVDGRGGGSGEAGDEKAEEWRKLSSNTGEAVSDDGDTPGRPMLADDNDDSSWMPSRRL